MKKLTDLTTIEIEIIISENVFGLLVELYQDNMKRVSVGAWKVPWQSDAAFMI